MSEIVLPTMRCLRCGHTWPPRKPERPLRCPKCGSPYWDRARATPASAPATPGGEGER